MSSIVDAHLCSLRKNSQLPYFATFHIDYVSGNVLEKVSILDARNGVERKDGNNQRGPNLNVMLGNLPERICT